MTDDELKDLAADVRSALADAGLRDLKPYGRSAVKQVATGSRCIVARPAPGIWFSLYYDESASQGQGQCLWYGFDCSHMKDGKRVRDAAVRALGMQAATRNDFYRPLTRSQYDNLLWEPVKDDGYYVGYYVHDVELGGTPRDRLLYEIGEFAKVVWAGYHHHEEAAGLSQRILRQVNRPGNPGDSLV
ncbi:hypothetical protein ACFJIW_09775 [Tahibacter sp. UC22_41]|uniref:hypothetical protein n=1 Tax=Tahibacter sp. UC22_41 TaxID=3350178 RepID=UPI0036DC8209